MFPEGFTTKPRGEGSDDLDVLLDGRVVAQLVSSIDGMRWVAYLDRHWPIGAPLVMRPCESRESGLAGLAAWAERNRDRLRAEFAGQRPRYLAAPED